MTLKTTVQQLKKGTIVLTMPAQLARMLGWQKGTKIEWTHRNNVVQVRKVKNE